MKLSITLLLFGLIAIASSIPYRDQLALLNSLQVGRNEDPMQWACAGCDQNTKPIRSHAIEENKKDVKAILSVYDEYTVLAFRYTATILNIGQDLLWAFQVQDQHSCIGCKVQRQYDRMWNSIRDDTLDDLKKSPHTNRLIITGISLGGGLATISYVDIAKSGLFEDIEIVTFGSPRVGNKKWANWFDLQTPSSRYFIKRDPIAILPRCLFPFICNYRQVGTAISCNKRTQVCTQKTQSEAQAEEFLDYEQLVQDVQEAVQDHINEDDHDDNLEGIIDHIFGYKKIKDYSLVSK